MILCSRLSAGLAATTTLAGLGAGVLLVAAPADAATHHVVHRTFAAHGLVVSRSAHSMTVLARTLKTGHSVRHDVRVTVGVPSSGRSGKALTKRLRATDVGDTVDVSGDAAGTGHATAFSAHGITDHATPFHAYLGVVTSVGPNSLVVDKAARSSDDPSEGSDGSFAVDTTNAVMSVDGTPGTPVPGDTVAILGSQNDDVVVATSVWGFSSAPTVLGGKVQSVAGSVVTFGNGESGHGRHGSHADGHGGPGGHPAHSMSVDLTGVALVLNGVSGATPDELTTGTRILVLGSADPTTGTFTPSLALAFSHDCSSHHHGDGGRDGGHGHGHGSGGGGDDS